MVPVTVIVSLELMLYLENVTCLLGLATAHIYKLYHTKVLFYSNSCSVY